MPSPLRVLLPAVLLALTLVLAALPARDAAAFRLGGPPAAILANPADRLAQLPPDPVTYDTARRCDPRPKPGTSALVAWLARNAEGVSWGTYRCERWGPDEASLHAEGRAVDWHLDARDPAQRAAGARLIRLLLAPDAAGTPHALARRMGVQEVIWDCSYWGAGAAEFSRYGACFTRAGKRRRRVDATVGHLDHVHVGLTRAGAARRTSYWRAG